MKRSLLISALFAARAFGACPSGFIQITDPFLNPDGSQWTGAITYTLGYATTAAGATIINARQNINVYGGISLCLAPGLYTPVTLNQSGQKYTVTSQWTVPISGGPYTVANLLGAVALYPGSFVSPLLYNPTTGAASIQQATTSQNGYLSAVDWNRFNTGGSAPGSNTGLIFNNNGAYGASSFLGWDDVNHLHTVTGSLNLTNTGAQGYSVFGAPILQEAPISGRDNFYVGVSTPGTAFGSSRGFSINHEFDGSAGINPNQVEEGLRVQNWIGTGSSDPLTFTAFGGGFTNRIALFPNGTGLISLATAVSAGIYGNGATGSGPITDSAIFQAETPRVASGATWGSHAGLWVRGGTTTGAITRRFGVRADPMAGGTDQCATIATGNWGACINDRSYFGSDLTANGGLTANSFSNSAFTLKTSTGTLLPNFAEITPLIANSSSRLFLIPSGTNTSSQVSLFNKTDPDNSGNMVMAIGTTNASLVTGISGTGVAPANLLIGETATSASLSQIVFEFHGVSAASITPTMFTAPSLTDSALTAGIVRSGSSGLFSSAELSGDATTSGSNAVTVSKLNGNIPGGTCTNQAVTVVDASGRPTCTTLTSAYTDTSIAKTGADINTSNQVIATHLTPVTCLGSGASSQPGVVACANYTAQSATLGAITLYAPTTGLYQLNDYITVSTSQTGAGVTLAASLAWADDKGAQSLTTTGVPFSQVTSGQNSLEGLFISGNISSPGQSDGVATPFAFWAVAGTSITYNITTVGQTTGRWALHLSLVKLL